MLSVILVNYNTFQLTRNCIASIHKHCKDLALEIIVVSNASSDRNIQELKQEFPSLNIIENSENLGFAKANNIGIAASKGDYLVLLNSDTELLNDAFSICISKLQSDPHIGVVSSSLCYPDGKLQHCCQSFPSITAEILETTRLFKLMHPDKVAQNYLNARLDLNLDQRCDWLWGTFFMFRKSSLQLLPGKKLSERFFMYGEDMEWCYQFKQQGLSCYYAAEARVLHLMGQSDFGKEEKKYAVIVRHELDFLKAYRGSAYALVLRLCKSFKFFIQSFKDKHCWQFARLYAFPK